VAELDAVAIQPLRNFQRPLVNFSIVGAVDGSFDRSRNDLLGAMDCCGVFDDPVTQQRPVLHQSKHTVVPPVYLSLSRVLGGPSSLARGKQAANGLVAAWPAAKPQWLS